MGKSANFSRKINLGNYLYLFLLKLYQIYNALPSLHRSRSGAGIFKDAMSELKQPGEGEEEMGGQGEVTG
jgi:hypothetical protein